MISVTPHIKILLAVEPVDFRKGIDGLAATCRQVFDANPFSGFMFVFRNKKATAIKILMYDGQGFWLCQKRLSSGRFNCLGGSLNARAEEIVKTLTAHEFQQLQWNAVHASPAAVWEKIEPVHF